MVRALGRSDFPKFGPHISRTKKEKHAHMDTLFLLSSACLLPITEVCREGPHDWFTGCKEDKQVYGLANTCQGWIGLKPEPKGKRRSRKEKSSSHHGNKHVGNIVRGCSSGGKSAEMCQCTVICFSEVICCSIMGSLLKGT